MGSLISLAIMGAIGLCCALIASNRGRSPVAWFFIGFLLHVIGLILLVVLPNLRVQEERENRLRTENRRLRERVKKDRPAGVGTLGPAPILPDGPTDYGDLEWFYVRDGSKVGPMSLHQLQTCWRHGLVASGTLVWNRDLEEWTQVGDLKDLEDRLVE